MMDQYIPLSWYLIFAAILFCIGLYGVMARRNGIAILMGIELMLNAVNVNLVAFWHYHEPFRTSAQMPLGAFMTGQVFAVMVFAVAAAEVAVGLALFISIYRQRKSIVAEEIDMLKF
jgi:NADH:ubiquinone oxidoreductase subunit K